jgi:hypothetical protein
MSASVLPSFSGDVLQKIAAVREKLGNLKAKKKDGVKFKVRSAEELNDKLRGLAIEQGLLIYPREAAGTGFPVEDGTLASVNLSLRIQAVSDGSYVDVCGFGLGADTQDKAGGKAMTYAWKAALIQTFLAGGAEDTDDSDTPIPGGVKKRGAGKPTVEGIRADLAALQSPEGFREVALRAAKLSFEQQQQLMDDFAAARQKLGLPAKGSTQPSGN